MSRQEFAANRAAGLRIRNELRLTRAEERSTLALMVRFLRANGFPYAERRPMVTGRELGAITGTPGVVWSVKTTRDQSGTPDQRQVDGWVLATEAHLRRAGGDVAVLVVAVPGAALAEVPGWPAVVTAGPGRRRRLSVGDVASLLVAMGYGGGSGPDDPSEAA